MNAYAKLHMESSLAKTYADLQTSVPPAGVTRVGLKQYKRQLAESRSILYQKRALQMITGEENTQAEVRRQTVLKRVTREFWTNFVVRGEETAMLKHLQARLREEFGQDLRFYYPPGDVQMTILHDTGSGYEEVKPQLHATIVNRAWQIARELVASHMF